MGTHVSDQGKAESTQVYELKVTVDELCRSEMNPGHSACAGQGACEIGGLAMQITEPWGQTGIGQIGAQFPAGLLTHCTKTAKKIHQEFRQGPTLFSVGRTSATSWWQMQSELGKTAASD